MPLHSFQSNAGGVTVLFGKDIFGDSQLVQKTLSDKGATRVLVVTSESGSARNGKAIDKALGTLKVGTWTKVRTLCSNADAVLFVCLFVAQCHAFNPAQYMLCFNTMQDTGI